MSQPRNCPTPLRNRRADLRPGAAAALLLAALCLRAISQEILFAELPANEAAAARQIDEGILGRSVWEQVAPFYRQPLSVPLGELRYLADLFPWLPDDMPVTARELSRYVPWTPALVDTFFADHSYLKDLRPILSFADRGVSHVGNVSFLSKTQGVMAPSAQTARFSLAPVPWFEAAGTVDFDNQHARWERRRLAVEPQRIGSVQAGNVNGSMDPGLFFGYFAQDTAADLSLGDNWLRGTVASWNGLAARIGLGRVGDLGVLLHRRSPEQVAGTRLNLTPGRNLRVKVGGALLEAAREAKAPDTCRVVLGGIDARVLGWRLVIESGIDIARPWAVPLFARLARGTRGQSAGVTAVVLPAGFYAPLGRLPRSMAARLGEDDSLTSGVTSLQVRVRDDRLDILRRELRFSYLAGGGSGLIDLVMALSGTAFADYRLRYGLGVDNAGEATRHRWGLLLRWPAHGRLRTGLSSEGYLRSPGYRRLATEASCIVETAPGLYFEPFGQLVAASDGTREWTVGLVQTMAFFERTGGEVRIEVPLGDETDGEVYVRAGLHFMF